MSGACLLSPSGNAAGFVARLGNLSTGDYEGASKTDGARFEEPMGNRLAVSSTRGLFTPALVSAEAQSTRRGVRREAIAEQDAHPAVKGSRFEPAVGDAGRQKERRTAEALIAFGFTVSRL